MFRTTLFTLAAACLAALPAPGLATSVSPVVIDISTAGRGVVQNISVTNTGASALPIEIMVTQLRPTATGFEPIEGSDADEDLLVSPPSALIAAGKTQSFRVQWIGEPDLAASKHFYVSINQLPVKLPEGQSAVQVVYNFQVLVSVSSPNKKPQLALTSVAPATVEGKPVAAVTVHNNGQAHGYISQRKIKITQTDASGAEGFSKTVSGAEFQQLVGYGLVATGQTRTVNVPLDKPLPAGAKLSAVLMDERAQ
jgi:P pilus assembly chaperone PapD